jgi:hypothetical protein
MGIVFHTSYTDGKVNYNPDLSVLKNTKDVSIIKNDITGYKLSDVTRNILKSTQEKWLQGNTTDFSSLIKQADIFCKFINKKIRDEVSVKSAQELVNTFSQENPNFDKGLLTKVFACFCKIAECKQFVIEDLNKVKLDLSEFYLKNGKYEETNPEGYVIVIDNGVVKLVNREDFSKENFVQDKDWDDDVVEQLKTAI